MPVACPIGRYRVRRKGRHMKMIILEGSPEELADYQARTDVIGSLTLARTR